MLKAVLIIGALSGVGGDHRVPMETMKECLNARKVIEKQDPYISTLCITAWDEGEKVRKFFQLFENMIKGMKRNQNEFDRLEQCDRQWDQCNKQSDRSSVLRKK